MNNTWIVLVKIATTDLYAMDFSLTCEIDYIQYWLVDTMTIHIYIHDVSP